MSNKNKPDLFLVLAIVVGIGVIASSLAQGVVLNSPEIRAAQLINANPMLQSAAPSTVNKR